jgi:hypothetical protein
MCCPRCGYLLERKARIDRAHFRRTGEIRLLVTKRGGPTYHETERLGHGAYNIAYHGKGSIVGGIHKPIDERLIANFRRRLGREGVDETRSWLARWDSREQRVEEIVGRWFDPFAGSDG